MISREEILGAFPLAVAMEREGIKLVGSGPHKMALCCFHQEKTPSMSVNVDKGTFYCFGCQVGGSVIDFMARRRGVPVRDVIKELALKLETEGNSSPIQSQPQATYVYRDDTGKEIFRVLRYPPAPPTNKKTFRQQRKTENGWAWGMEGVKRILYRLPEINAAKAAPVWITEGEKDADNLVRFGFNATTNVGGAGKWMDGYTESLLGRDVVICGDNDETGKVHVKKVSEALDGKVKSLRVITVPAPAKDVSEFLAGFGSLDAGSTALEDLYDKAPVVVSGSTIPILSMAEMEVNYKELISESSGRSYRFGDWLPTFNSRLRPCVPGDVIVWAAATGVGKTALLQNMAIRAAPLPTLLFEMELAETITFERFVAASLALKQNDVEYTYRSGYTPEWREKGDLSSIFVCPMSGLTPQTMEKIIDRAELKMGTRPTLVMVDYIQLVQGIGNSRYERMTQAMCDIKSMAKNTGTIVVVASQIQRSGPKKEGEDAGVGIGAAKDSGQIENSASLHIGAWKESRSDDFIIMRINKNTRGRSGLEIRCTCDGERMLIEEERRKQGTPTAVEVDLL